MMLVDFKGNVSSAQGAICVELTIGSKTFPTAFLSLKGWDLIIYCWVRIGYMQIVAYHLQCINASSNGLSGSGARRNLLDSGSYRSTRMDL
jgi:hypothetical protein